MNRKGKINANGLAKRKFSAEAVLNCFRQFDWPKEGFQINIDQAAKIVNNRRG